MEPLEETISGFSSKRYQSTVEKLVNFEMPKMLMLKKKLAYENLVISKIIWHQEKLKNIKEFSKKTQMFELKNRHVIPDGKRGVCITLICKCKKNIYDQQQKI